MGNAAISVLLAKTNSMMCQLLANSLVASQYPLRCCQTEAEIVPLLQQHPPTVAFVGHDIAQDGNSLALATRLKAQFPAVGFVLFTKTVSFEEALAALVAHIDGYIFYEDGLNSIFECIDCVVRGTPYFSHAAQKLLDGEPDASVISKQEAKVLALVAQRYSNKEIAEQLHISLFTVQDHRRNVRLKLGLKGGKNILMQYLKYTPPL